MGLRLEGRGWRWPDGAACWNPRPSRRACEAAWLLRMRGEASLSTPPRSSRPERSGERAGISEPAGWEPHQSPHPEEQTRLGLRLEGRGLAGPDGSACWNPSSFETPCEAAWLLRMRVLYYLMLTIFLYLPSCVHSSPKRGRFRSGLWRGGEAAPAPVEYRSAVPGGLLKAAGRNGLNPMRKAVSLPALDYAGAVSESALRRDGEGRSPMDPLRVTGSVGRGDIILPALREVGFRPRRQTGATLRAGLDETPAPGTKETPPSGTERPASRRKEGQPSPVGSVG